jgi:ubiquinol-cytochrome c reductase cytochrome c1 subunit
MQAGAAKGDVEMKKLSVIAGMLCVLLVSAAAFAQEEIQLDRAPLRDKPVELQAGARTFVNYCMGCHGLSAARYSQLEKLGLSEAEIKDNLMFPGAKIGDMMTVALTAKDGKQFFGTAPPDLSVIARSRGADWLYSYLRSFYRDPSRPTGWNNMVFPNVGMPNVLWTLSGDNKLTEKEFDKEHDAEAAQRAIRALSQVEEKGGADKGPGKYTLKYLEQDKKGAQTPVEFDTTVADLVGFLVYIGEPHAAERRNLGYLVLFGLFLLVMFTYFLKKEFWSDVH